MAVKISLSDWIKEAEKTHGKGTYDYSEVSKNFENGRTKVKIKCNKCGKFFYQSLYRHVTLGRGCRDCRNEEVYERYRKEGKDSWEDRVTKKWGNVLDLTQAIKEYKGNTSKVTATCKVCGTTFTITASHLLDGVAPCPECCKRKNAQIRTKTTEEFIKEAEEVHGKGEYDYSKVDYKGCDKPVLIIDPKRNNEEFYQCPRQHLRGCGNPNRKSSGGESLVSRWLENNSISYNKEVKVKEIVGRTGEGSGVRIDFCLVHNDKNYWIEVNGSQHYKINSHVLVEIKKLKGEELKEYYLGQITRDQNVRTYCKEHNIILIEIPYSTSTYNTYNKISEALTKIILEGLNPGDVIEAPEIEQVENNETQNIESNDDNS